MTIVRSTLFVLCLAGTAAAGDLTIQSRFPGGFELMQPGSALNPYVVRDGYGRQVGTIHSRMPDLDPHDGLTDPGTSLNPWVLHTDE